jgi:hypothetical protein
MRAGGSLYWRRLDESAGPGSERGMKRGISLGSWIVAALLAVQAAGQAPAPRSFDFDFNIAYSGSYISGRLVGLQLDANGSAAEADPATVLLFHLPAIVGLPASPAQPYVFVPHTYERSTYFSGTLITTTPGVLGFHVTDYVITPAQQNLLMIDATNDVTLVFNFGASLSSEGGVATYGIQGNEDALWPAINSNVSFTVAPWKDLGFGEPGVSGTPVLAGAGTLAPGTTATLMLTGARPLAAAWLVIGIAPAYSPLLGGTLVPQPDSILQLATDSAGALSLAVLLPLGFTSGVPYWGQSWIADPAATSGFSASNGIVAIRHP